MFTPAGRTENVYTCWKNCKCLHLLGGLQMFTPAGRGVNIYTCWEDCKCFHMLGGLHKLTPAGRGANIYTCCEDYTCLHLPGGVQMYSPAVRTANVYTSFTTDWEVFLLCKTSLHSSVWVLIFIFTLIYTLFLTNSHNKLFLNGLQITSSIVFETFILLQYEFGDHCEMIVSWFQLQLK